LFLICVEELESTSIVWRWVFILSDDISFIFDFWRASLKHSLRFKLFWIYVFGGLAGGLFALDLRARHSLRRLHVSFLMFSCVRSIQIWMGLTSKCTIWWTRKLLSTQGRGSPFQSTMSSSESAPNEEALKFCCKSLCDSQVELTPCVQLSSDGLALG
jgi:hypothetical protein